MHRGTVSQSDSTQADRGTHGHAHGTVHRSTVQYTGVHRGTQGYTGIHRGTLGYCTQGYTRVHRGTQGYTGVHRGTQTGEEAHWSLKRKAQDPEGGQERRMENRMKETNRKRETD